MDWKSLPAFLAVARAGSLRSAAEALDSTHATVRRQVEALESQLGTQLFRRSGEGLTLTPAGRQLLPQAIEAETALSKGFDAVRGLDREASGRIRLSVDPMTAHHVLAPALASFSALYPDVELDLRLSFGIDSIERDETDMSVRHVLTLDGDLIGRRLFPLGLGVFASQDYLERTLPKAGPKGEGLTWLGYGPAPEMETMIAASAFPRARVRHRIDDPEMHLHLARAGAGMTFLAGWAGRTFPELVRLPGTQIDRRRATWILMHRDLRLVRRFRVLMDFLAAALLERRADFIGPDPG